jgi:transcriptional regulator with XRE-family HTH domain
MTQERLAAEMRDRGFRWSQNTVWKVERGERPLRLSEATAAASILGRSVFDLERDDINRTLSEALHAMSAADQKLTEAMDQYELARIQLSVFLDWIKREGLDLDPHNAIQDWIDATLEEKVRQLAMEGEAEAAAQKVRDAYWARLDALESPQDDGATT